MNPNETEITGLIATGSGHNGTARLTYRIDLRTNRVAYVLNVARLGWTAEKYPDALEGRTEFRNYEIARRMFEEAYSTLSGKVEGGAE